MPTTSRAVVIRDLARGPQIETLNLRDPRPDEALVRMEASGICGSDIHVVHGHSTAAPLPTVMGHEGAGVVERVGHDVHDVNVGQRVVLGQGFGAPDVAVSGERLNLYAGQGSMSAYVLMPSSQLIPVPDDVPLDVMALTGCGVLTGIGTVVNIARPDPFESVLVVGCGGVGLNVMQTCDLFGAYPIIAVDSNAERLALADQFGATHGVLGGAGVSIVDEVRKVVPSGVDWAFEVVGNPALVRQAYDAAKPGGTCVVIGASPPGTTIELDARDVMISQKRLIGALMGGGMGQRDIPRIIDLYRRGRIKLDELVSARIPFDDALQAIEKTDAGAFARCLLTFS
jgi:S-(hydroxymethyl)glutathione dehydrogenase/alcohol dehydrogenase